MGLMSARSVAWLVLHSVAYTHGGYLGLRNQGNTCYMNSLLQALNHLPEFKQAIYRIPTTTDPSMGEAVPLELQRLFYLLEHAESTGVRALGTERLTRSFGWGTREVMVQQDVQEFASMLCDALRQSMSVHGVEDGVARLFEGTTSSVIRCTRVDFSSEREGRFLDLQMQVQGCRNLYQSLRRFVQEEQLTGANQYNTRDPKLGRQDARRSVRFKSLPPVLQLHLKRFEYDAESGTMHKLQQAFPFPTRLSLRRFMVPSASRSSQPSPEYQLYAVLSHEGDAVSGHYVAYVKPRGTEQWYEFDDTRVSAVREEVAVRQQYGGRHARGGGAFGIGNKPNAYMLIYLRRDLAEVGGAHADGVRADGEDFLSPTVRAAFDKELGRSAGPHEPQP